MSPKCLQRTPRIARSKKRCHQEKKRVLGCLGKLSFRNGKSQAWNLQPPERVLSRFSLKTSRKSSKIQGSHQTQWSGQLKSARSKNTVCK